MLFVLQSGGLTTILTHPWNAEHPMQLKDRGRLDMLELLQMQQAERFSLESAAFICCLFSSLNNEVPKLVSIKCSVFVSFIVLISMFCVFSVSNSTLKLSTTKIDSGLLVTRIGPKCALTCIKNVYIHICMQYSRLTHIDSLVNWKIISKLFLLNYPCLSGRFKNTF